MIEHKTIFFALAVITIVLLILTQTPLFVQFTTIINNNTNGASRDLNWSELNLVIPWQDVNVTDDLRINTLKDANFRNIQFGGTLSGGDFNYSLLDANDTQSCPVGQALSSVGNVTSCVAITGSGGDTNRTYTSGTPATIEVNNDLNTISQNFDGNFWSRAAPLFPVPDVNILNSARYLQDSSCDNNSLCHLLSGTFVWDNNAVLDGRYVNLTGDTMTGKLNTPDLNTTSFHVDLNATIDQNLLVKKDLNVNGQAGFDKNISMNTSGACLKIVGSGGTLCMCGNTIDNNVGFILYAC